MCVGNKTRCMLVGAFEREEISSKDAAETNAEKKGEQKGDDSKDAPTLRASCVFAILQR